MGHLVRSLLLVVVFGAAATAASGKEAMPPIPGLPAPADMPVTPPCLDSISMCASVYQDNSMLAPCCAAVKKLYKSDQKCICDAVAQAQKVLKEFNSKLNATLDGLEMFRQCEMPTTSCDPGKPAGSENIGNAAPNGRSIGAIQIMFLLPLFFMLVL